MRTASDMVTLRYQTLMEVSFDRERAELDPTWIFLTGGVDLNDPAVRAACEGKYVEYYIERDRGLVDMPSTNGPARVLRYRVEVDFGNSSSQ